MSVRPQARHAARVVGGGARLRAVLEAGVAHRAAPTGVMLPINSYLTVTTQDGLYESPQRITKLSFKLTAVKKKEYMGQSLHYLLIGEIMDKDAVSSEYNGEANVCAIYIPWRPPMFPHEYGEPKYEGRLLVSVERGTEKKETGTTPGEKKYYVLEGAKELMRHASV